MPAYQSLTHALAETVIDMTWFIEGTDDEQMDPDDAVKVLEGVTAVMDRLSTEQRFELLAILRAMAAAETHPSRREFIQSFPKDFGLIDTDD